MRLTAKQYQALTGKNLKIKDTSTAIAGAYRSRVQGERTIGGKTYYFRSLWEINYARILQFQKEQGIIYDWEYETHTFNFPKDDYKAGPFYYKPDFKVYSSPESHTWHEVKGWLNASSKKKHKRFRKHFPDETLIVIDEAWMYGPGKHYKDLIPSWERHTPARRSRRK